MTDKDTTNVFISHVHEDDAGLGKRIVGVWAHGENNCELPVALKDYADAMVGWHGDSIIDAITGKSSNWENPDGSQCPPRPIKRYSCG
jgi:hypothetical protein